MTGPDRQSIAFYDAEARAYAEKAARAHSLMAFAAALPAGGRVLDLGCGGGQDSAALRDLGFHVVSIDASPGLAAEAKRRWNLDVRVREFADIDYDTAFDGILASASLHHAPSDELPDIFHRLRRALKPGGLLRASLKGGDADRRDALGRFYCAMDEARLRALLADWADVRIEMKQGAGYDGEATPWLAVWANAQV